MPILEFDAGCHISKAAEQLVSAAKDLGEAQGTFNGIILEADRTSTIESIVADYDRQSEERAIAWRNSPEGTAAAAKREADVRGRQEKHDVLMSDLATLDFKNDVAVLDWLCAIQDATDDVSVVVHTAGILAAFAAHGFAPNANCNEAFDPSDRENVFRWFVGQTLDGLAHGAIHSLIHKFAVEWKEKFVEPA